MKTQSTKKPVDLSDKLNKNKQQNRKQQKEELNICPHCGAKLTKFSNEWQPTVCENPTCPLNDYTPKGNQ